jgi:hypothetical protein
MAISALRHRHDVGKLTPHCNDFIINPFGNGWHVDRRRSIVCLWLRAIAVCGS